jgi:hypothetical protein
VSEMDLAALDATLDEAHENAVEDAVPDDLYASGVTLAQTRALVAALRAAWRENERYRALLTSARYGIDSWSTVDLDRLIDEIDAALAVPGAGGQATEEQP